MGTNYYLRTNICEHCGRYDEHHIGKHSGGWSFGFHGERCADLAFNPLGAVVDCEQHWRDLLKTGSIVDEYDEVMPEGEFWAMVDHARTGRNHTEYCREHNPSHAMRSCWLDDRGNSFTEGDFS